MSDSVEYTRRIARALFSSNVGQPGDDAAELLIALADLMEEADGVSDCEDLATLRDKLLSLPHFAEHTFSNAAYDRPEEWFRSETIAHQR